MSYGNFNNTDFITKLQSIDRQALEDFLKTYTPKAKKKLPSEIKQYKTAWYFTNEQHIDKQVFECVRNFYSNTKAFKNKELWGKYATFQYLSGARRSEPFLMNPTIRKEERNGSTYYEIKRINEKHNERRSGKRVTLTQTFYAFNTHEKALFNFLMGNNTLVTLDFTPLLSENKRNVISSTDFKNAGPTVIRNMMANISERFVNLFKADITDGEGVREEHGGLPPHLLRHARAYDLWINEGMKPDKVQRLLGWDRLATLEYYVDLRNAMKERELIEEYERLQQERKVTPNFFRSNV